jgi:hypothetical protein
MRPPCLLGGAGRTGSRQSRPILSGEPDRVRPGPRSGNVVVDAERHADDVSRRRHDRSPIASPLVHDPWEKNVPGFGLDRDPVRTPMQWTPERHAGFTSGEPWLPIGPAVAECSDATEPSEIDAIAVPRPHPVAPERQRYHPRLVSATLRNPALARLRTSAFRWSYPRRAQSDERSAGAARPGPPCGK